MTIFGLLLVCIGIFVMVLSVPDIEDSKMKALGPALLILAGLSLMGGGWAISQDAPNDDIHNIPILQEYGLICDTAEEVKEILSATDTEELSLSDAIVLVNSKHNSVVVDGDDACGAAYWEFMVGDVVDHIDTPKDNWDIVKVLVLGSSDNGKEFQQFTPVPQFVAHSIKPTGTDL